MSGPRALCATDGFSHASRRAWGRRFHRGMLSGPDRFPAASSRVLTPSPSANFLRIGQSDAIAPSVNQFLAACRRAEFLECFHLPRAWPVGHLLKVGCIISIDQFAGGMSPHVNSLDLSRHSCGSVASDVCKRSNDTAFFTFSRNEKIRCAKISSRKCPDMT